MTPNGCLFKHCLKKPYYIGGGGGGLHITKDSWEYEIYTCLVTSNGKYQVQYTLTIVHVHVLPSSTHCVQIKILIIRHVFTSLFLWLLILLLACYKNKQNVVLIMQYNRLFYIMDVFEKDVKIFGSALLLTSAWNADSNNYNTLEIN